MRFQASSSTSVNWLSSPAFIKVFTKMPQATMISTFMQYRLLLKTKNKLIHPVIRFSVFALLLIASAASAQPKVVDKVVGIVDDRIVLLSEIEAQYLQLTYGSDREPPPDLKCTLLETFLM